MADAGDLKPPAPPSVPPSYENHESARPRSEPITEAAGQSWGNVEAPPDVVEAALADAITKASAAGAWDAVTALTRELQARRESRAGVVPLDARRRKGQR